MLKALCLFTVLAGSSYSFALDVQNLPVAQVLLHEIKQAGQLDPYMEFDAIFDDVDGKRRRVVDAKVYSLEFVGNAEFKGGKILCKEGECFIKKFRLEMNDSKKRKANDPRGLIVANIFIDKDKDGNFETPISELNIGIVTFQGVLKLDNKISFTIIKEFASTLWERATAPKVVTKIKGQLRL